MKFASILKAAKSAKQAQSAANDFRQADKRQMGRDAGHFAYTQGTDKGKTVAKTWLKTFEVIPRVICRGTQFILALIAIGFYGHRVDADRKDGTGFSPEWLFAVIIGGLSAVTSMLFLATASAGMIPFVGSKLKMLKTYRAFWWDGVLFISWMVVFGIFAKIFLKRQNGDTYKGADTGAMKTAIWVDLISAIFWFMSGVYGFCKTCLGRKVDGVTEKAGNKMFQQQPQPDPQGRYGQQGYPGFSGYPQAV